MHKFAFGKIYPEIEIITKFHDIENFEPKKDSIYKTCPVKLIGVEDINQISLELFDDESDYGIILIDKYEIIKKTFFLKPVKLKKVNRNSVNIEAYLFGGSKGVTKAWKNYFSTGIKEYNLWKNLKPSERQGWLELAISCQNIDFENLKTIIEINGSDIKCYDDFYCALGEALNGPGGYFGRNLDALADCISSSEFGTKKLQKIVWKNSKKCKWKLKKSFKSILDIFYEYQIEVELQ